MMRATPSAASSRAMAGTVKAPSTGCPPVMATASLNNNLKVMLTAADSAARIASNPE